MLTLLCVNNYYYPRGGAEVVFLEQERLFRAAGWQVVPFAMRHPHNLATPWSDYFVDEIEFGHAYSPWEKLRRVPKVIFSLEARRKLRRLLDAVPVSVCHLHNIYHHISPSILGVLRQRAVPVVLTLHDLKLACPAYKMLAHDGVCERCKGGHLRHVMGHRCVKGSLALSALAYLEARLHRMLNTYGGNVDRFTVPSRFYLHKLVEWGVPADKLVYVPNFVDVDAFRPRTRVGRSFLYFGRLGPEKGTTTLIAAAARAQVPLHIAGTGPEEAPARRLAERLGAEVIFLGHLSGAPLRAAIAAARATVLPSEWYENAPMSVLESYASGVPVLGAAIGGIGELIRENETGATFSSGSVEDLAARLRWLADLPDRRVTEMGQCARAWVEREFTAAQYRHRLSQLYAELGVTGSTDVRCECKAVPQAASAD